MIVGLLLLSLLLLVDSGEPPCSSPIPGLPGIPGTPGRDGRDGLRGAKGEKDIGVRRAFQTPTTDQRTRQSPATELLFFLDSTMETWARLLRLGLILLSIPFSEAQSCQANMPGLPGVPGIPGADGNDGVDGAKGDVGSPGVFEGWNKEELCGDPGPAGNPGKVGPKGPMGPPGPPGPLGQKGRKGDSGEYKTDGHSAFSVRKMSPGLPRREQPVRFDQSLINVNNQYNTMTGKFTCQHPGIYYFTYHVTSRGHLCVNIMRGKPGATKQKVVNFCDQVLNLFQVTTGGVVLEVQKDETVWLETTEKNNLLGTDGADSIFTGFLLFPLS